MGDGTYYYIMQTIKGSIIAHGPYSSESGAENRMDKIKGGEVSLFRSFSSDSEVALDEFKEVVIT